MPRKTPSESPGLKAQQKLAKCLTR